MPAARPSRPAALALIAALAAVLAAPAVAAQGQVVTATVQSEATQTPEELPGDYEVDLLVTVEAAGGQCLCERTQVTIVSTADTVVDGAFDPASYEIDWVQQAQDGDGGTHEQAVDATITVPEVEEEVNITVEAQMTHEPGALIHSRTNPATLVLPVPEGGANASQASANLSPAGADGEAQDGGTEGVPAPALAGLLAAGLAAAHLARRR